MGSNDLKNATFELAKYFSLYTLQDLIGTSIKDRETENNPNTTNLLKSSNVLSQNIGNSDPINRISEIIVDSQTGAYSTKEIIDEIERQISDDTQEDLRSKISIIYDGRIWKPTIKEVLGVRGSDINENISSPTKDNPALSAFLVNTIRINPSNRNANAVALFMNTIPTIEFSRCVPFIDVQFQTFRTSRDSSGRAQTLSLITFLDGASQIKDSSANYAMHTAKPANEKFTTTTDFQGKTIGEDGTGFTFMDIFTSPQTLLNVDSSDDESIRIAPVIDKFRPFLSLRKLTINVVPTTGVMSYKTAELILTLHDSSRLHEIADFIKPDLAGARNSELLIEYGWNHPDNESPFGFFLNSTKKKEKYHIRNSSFAFKDNREVEITLDLFMKGALEFYNTTITEGGDVGKIQKVVADVQKRVSDLRSRVFNNQSAFVKEIRGIQILNTASDTTSQLALSKDLKKELKKTMSALDGVPGDEARQLKAEIKKLYGTNGDDGEASALLKTLAEEFQTRMKLIEKTGKSNPTPDPFLSESRIEQFFDPDRKNDNNPSNFVSFGKLATIFIGQPLASSKKFDEVQLIFYPLNDAAGFGRFINTGNFAIEISRFREKFDKIKNLRRSVDLTIRDFTQFMSNFFDDPAALDYGMRRFYKYDKNKETGSVAKPKKIAKKGQLPDLNDEYEKLMTLAGVPNKTFKMPVLDVYVECLPGESLSEKLKDKNVENSKTILKIHFIDRTSSSYASLGDLLKSVRDEEIGNITRLTAQAQKDGTRGSEAMDHDNIAAQIISQAKALNLIESDSNSGNGGISYRVKGGPRAIKDFVSNTMPAIIFGSNNTAIVNSGFKTMNEPRLSTVNMLRSADTNPLTPEGSELGGLPLWMHPAQMDMQLIGCPILEFMLGLFVDFHTNTSIDNIYHVTKLTHEIESGHFMSSISLIPTDGYGTYRALRDKIAGAISISEQLSSEEENQDEFTNTTS